MTKSLYQDHFEIRENPFSIIPDPHYLFMSKQHQDALAHLLYGISESGGFVLLTGEVGTGKTTICRTLIEQLPDNVDLALILNPKLTEVELMAAICDEMRITYPADTLSLKLFFDVINAHLLAAHAQGRNPVLMIDEAQNLSPQVLEMVRLLTNLETADKKLLQIILVGQPELNDILAQNDQRQTSQRITARYHLNALSLSECRKYVAHRLTIAGLNQDVFSPPSIKVIYKAARGIPRLINSVCDRALLAAYVEDHHRISRRLAHAAAREVLGSPARPRQSNFGKVVAITLALTVVILGLGLWVKFDPYNTGIQQTVQSIFTSAAPPPPKAQPVVKQAKPEPEPEAKAEPELTGTPDTIDSLGTPDMAFRHLFTQWQINYMELPGLTPCEKSKAVGLSCVQGPTDFIGLKAINRPAVLSILRPNESLLYGVIQRITPTHVIVQLNHKDISLSHQEFAAQWQGDYLVLWRDETQIERVLSENKNGLDVVKLRALLRGAGYSSQSQDPQNYDEALTQVVQAFQGDHNLDIDGMVGPNTLMRITGVAGMTQVNVLVKGDE